MQRNLLIAGLAFLLVLGVLAFRVSTAQNDGPDLRNIMQQKLGHAQNILEGLTRENFTQIEKAARSLGQLSRAAGWNVHQTPEYLLYTQQFQQQVDSLAEFAKQKKLEACTLEYVQMTMTCVNCHTHVRKIGVASLDDPATLMWAHAARP